MMFASKCSLTLASSLLITAMATAQVSWPVQSARFVHEDGTVVEVDGISTVDVSRPSMLMLRVAFQSDLYMPDTENWTVGEVDFRWRFKAGEELLPFGLGVGSWVGASLPKPHANLLEFDRSTGEGSLRLSIPLGAQVGGTELRFPLLPEATSHLEIGLGWKDVLSIDEQGEVTGAFSSFELDVLPACPDVWIDPVSRALPVMALHHIAIISRESIQTERVYVLHNPWPDMVRFDADLSSTEDLEVVFPAEEAIVIVPIRAIETGPFSLELHRACGEILVTSGLIEGTYAFGATLDRITDAEGKVLPGAMIDDASLPDEFIYGPDEEVPPYDGAVARRCIPASAPSGETYASCSKCFPGTEADHTCAETATPWTSARCPTNFLYSCYPTNKEITTFDYEGVEVSTSGCTVGGLVTSIGVAWHFLTYQAGPSSASGVRICCTYKKVPGSANDKLVKSCTGSL